MENKTIDGVKVAVNYAQASDAPVSDEEIAAYIKRAHDKGAPCCRRNERLAAAIRNVHHM